MIRVVYLESSVPDTSNFEEAVEERFRELKEALDKDIVAAADRGMKTLDVSELHARANNLNAILASSARPEWLKTIMSAAKKHAVNKNSNTAVELLRTIVANYTLIRPIVLSDEHSPYDFDSLYEAAYKSGQLPRLFEELAKLLKEIMESGEVESVTVLETLQELLVVLRVNRDGSYTATKGIVRFVEFVRIGIREHLKHSKYTKHWYTAWEEVTGAISQEEHALDKRIEDSLKEQVKTSHPRLEHVRSEVVSSQIVDQPSLEDAENVEDS